MRSPASSGRATTDPATDVERQQALRHSPTGRSVQNEPMTVASRGRLYTTEDIRQRLGCDDRQAGRGTRVAVKIDDVDRHGEWLHVNTAVFRATLATDGVIRIPAAVRDELNLSTGDDVRVSIRTNE